jgi:peptidoglycan/LPS O-acetylase OafA/YrhL
LSRYPGSRVPPCSTYRVRSKTAEGLAPWAAWSTNATVTNYNIDVVRSYLAQWIIVSHLALDLVGIQLIPGRIAVWGFFVISGYLNALSFNRTWDSSSFFDSVVAYYRRRMTRIYPMLIFSYAVVSIVLGVAPSSDLAILFPVRYFYNFELMNGVLWTLGIELQFYLLTPLLVLWLSGEWPRKHALALLFLCAASVYVVPLAHAQFMGDSRLIDDRTMLGNLGLYIFGMVLALARAESLAIWARVARWTIMGLAVYAAMFLWLFNTVGQNWKVLFTMGQPLVFVAAFAVICLGTRLHAGHERLFGFLGYYTYEIYILHGLGVFLLSQAGVSGNISAEVLVVWVLPVTTVGILQLLRQAGRPVKDTAG